MGQVFVRRTNTLSKTRGLDEYPTQKMGQLFVHRRIRSRKHEAKHGASIRPRTNTRSKGRMPSAKHGASIRPRTNNRTNTLSKIWGNGRIHPQKHGHVFVHGRILSKSWASIRLFEHLFKNMPHGASSHPWTTATFLLKSGASTHLRMFE